MNFSGEEMIDLSGLRDVHDLAQPSFFPPAIGWWILLIGILGIILIGWGWYRFYYMSSKKYAQRELRHIFRAKLPTMALGVEIGKLLKRVALIRFPREDVAKLSGEAWADFLCRTGGRVISREQAKFIAESAFMPAQKTVAIDEKKLYTAVYQWINGVFKKVNNGN